MGDTIGGSHHSGQILISEINKIGITPVVLIHQKGPLVKFFEDHDIIIHAKSGEIPYWAASRFIISRIFRWLFVSYSLLKIIKKLRIEAVHVNDARMMITWALTCKLAKIPLIVHQRTKFSSSRIAKFCMGTSKNIISISNFVHSTLPTADQKKSVVIDNPVHSKQSQANIKELKFNLNIQNDAVVLLFVGTIQAQKRPLTAIRILKELLDNGQNVILLMAGRCSDKSRQELSELINKLYLTDHIQILGYREDIGHLMTISDILIAPAVNEGFGRSIIEAMKYELPVVASNSGGHSEIIKDNLNGILCPPDSLTSFSDAIMRLLDDKVLYSKIVKEAVNFANVRFNPIDHASQVAKLYNSSFKSIALVIESMGGGGTQQIVKSLSYHWLSKGRKQTLITFKDQSFDEVKLDKKVHRIVIKRLSPSKTIIHAAINNFKRILNIRKALISSEAQIIVSFLSTTNILVLIASIGLSRKIIVSERNDPNRQPLSLTWRLLRRYTYPWADALVCNSQTAADFFKENTSCKEVLLVENSIRKINSSGNINLPDKFVLAVGRLHEQKRFDLLLHAFKRAGLADFKLIILGDGLLKKNLMELALNLGLKERVIFAGYVKNPHHYFKKASVFILCSDFEGSPNALWEALSFGVPSIVSNRVHEALIHLENSKNAIIVNGGSATSLSDALIEVSKDKNLSKILSNNGPKVIKKFSVSEINKKWDNILFGVD